jgi:hypothetical protein
MFFIWWTIADIPSKLTPRRARRSMSAPGTVRAKPTAYSSSRTRVSIAMSGRVDWIDASARRDGTATTIHPSAAIRSKSRLGFPIEPSVAATMTGKRPAAGVASRRARVGAASAVRASASVMVRERPNCATPRTPSSVAALSCGVGAPPPRSRV